MKVETPAAPAQDPGDLLQLEILALLERDAGADELTALLGRIDALPPDEEARRDRLTHSVHLGMAIRQRLEEQQQRERGLVAVIETARDLTALRDIEQVLEAIVRRARQLMGCQIGYLANYDRQREEFYMRATDGALSEDLRTLKLKRGIGLIGLIEKTGTPLSSADYQPDARFLHSELVDSIFREEGIRSILGVPLLVGGEVIGVLFVGDRYVRSYVPWELSILSTLAAHAAVAILNAHAFEESRAALQQASRANALLQKQAAGIQRAATAHEELTSLVAKGGGLLDLCRLVAGMLGGTVLTLDEAGRPMVGPAAPNGGEGPERDGPSRAIGERIRQALRESRTLGRSVAAAASPGEACRVSAVVGGNGILGGLVIWTPAELDEFAVRIFERSAVVTGVLLLSQERTELAANADRSAILRSLLSWQQADWAHLSAGAARHGLDLSRPMALAAVEVEGGRASYLLRQVRGTPGLETMLLDEVDGLLVVLAGANQSGMVHRFLEDRLRAEWGDQINAVVARPVDRAADLARAYQSLRRCLGLLRSLRRRGCVAAEAELSPYAVVFEKQGGRDLDALLGAVIGPLLEEDRERGSALAETLLAYLDHGYNARKTAASLGIHVNTLRQRFETIRDLIGDWAGTPRALEIHLALRLWKLRGG
jgi:sugar diacid utilization regulator